MQTTGRDEEALAEYEAALKLDPAQSGASHGAAKVAERLALKLSSEGHVDDALAVLARAKNVVPASADLLPFWRGAEESRLLDRCAKNA